MWNGVGSALGILVFETERDWGVVNHQEWSSCAFEVIVDGMIAALGEFQFLVDGYNDIMP